MTDRFGIRATWMLGRMLSGLLTFGTLLILFYERWLSIKSLKRRVKRLIGRDPGKLNPTQAVKFRNETKERRAEARTWESQFDDAMSQQATQNPFDENKDTIFLVVTSGQAVRLILLTDVIERLKARFNVVIISQYSNNPAFVKEHGGKGVHLLPWFEKFKSRIGNVFQYYLMERSGSATHRDWLANLESRSPGQEALHGFRTGHRRFDSHAKARKFSNALGAVFGARGLLHLYHAFLLSYLPRRILRRLFDRYRPCAVISTSSHHISAWPLTFFGRQSGIETLAYVISWDNCTTKVTLDPYCSSYAVWSEEMAEELHRCCPYVSARTFVVGSPLFDMYYRDDLLLDRRDFLKSLKLPEDRPYIVYATNTPAAMPDEPDLIADYWDALSRTLLAGKVSLLVRLHPADDIERYEALRQRPGLAITLANEGSEQGIEAWIPTRKNMSLLLNTIKHASVSVNVASTMSLESFAAGVPTINVGFRARPEIREKFLWRFAMYHTSEHYRALIDNGAVEVARNLDELVAMTRDVLEGTTDRREAMTKTLLQKAGFHDGASAGRLSDLMVTIGTRNAGFAAVRSPAIQKSSMAERSHSVPGT